MAGGVLVPHQLPDGRTVMVPDYLMPRQQGGVALQMPQVQAPQAGPDERLAFNSPAYESPLPGSQVDQGDVADFPAGAPLKPGTPEFRAHHVQLLHDQGQLAAQQQQQDAVARRKNFLAEQDARAYKAKKDANDVAAFAGRSLPNPGLIAPPAEVLARENPRQAAQTAAPGKENPNGLVRAERKTSPGAGGGGPASGDMDPLVRRVFNEGGGGGPRSPGGMVPNTIKVERQPGQDLIPEYKWALGLEKRPDFGRELDPNAEQPTWGNAEPITRERKTGIERGAEAAGQTAAEQFKRDEAARQELANAQHQQLLDQGQLIDQQLGTLADRRNRIAQLQDTADQRMQEAASMEPRTREQIWGSKGNVGRSIAMLAAVLGGAAQDLRGGPNAGWEMVKQSVDDTVNDERAESARRQQIGLAARSDFDHAMAVYGDVDMAMLDSKNRKLANMIAMTQQSLNDRGLDASAKDRAMAVQQAAQQQFLANRQQLHDLAQGKALKEEIDYKQAPATGGGGLGTLARLERAARAQKALNTISGQDNKPKASPAEGASLNEFEASLAPTEQLLSRYKSADNIPGIGGRNVVSRATRGAADFIAGEGSGSQALDTPEERANRQVVNDLRAGIKHAITGAGMSIKEAETLDELIVGARTKLDLENVIRTARTRIAAHRRLIAGGSSGAAEPAETPDSFQAEP